MKFTAVLTRSVAVCAAVATLSFVGISAANADAPTLSVTLAHSALVAKSGTAANDSTTVTVSEPGASADDSVSLEITKTSDASDVRSLDPVSLSADDDYTATATLDDTGLDDGAYTLVATSGDDDTVIGTADFTVDSVATVTIATTNGDTFYPRADGYKDEIDGTVSAEDADGAALPFSGTVSLGSASTAVSSTAPSAHAFALSIVGQTVGTDPQDLTFTVGDATDSTPVTLSATTVTSAVISEQYTTVYPSHDGFRDTDNLTVTVVAPEADQIPVKGTLALKKGSKTELTWPITHSGTTTINWSGKIHSKLVPGTYTLAASVSADNTVSAAHVSITASSKKLVEKIAKSTKDASSIIKGYTPLDSDQQSFCAHHKNLVGCFGYDADDSGYSLIAGGTSSVSLTVRKSFSYGKTPAVAVFTHTSTLIGHVKWFYASSDVDSGTPKSLKKGSQTLGWKALDNTSSKVGVSYGLEDYSAFVASSLTFEYKYWVLA